jgi:hypothetical protein
MMLIVAKLGLHGGERDFGSSQRFGPSSRPLLLGYA